MYDIRTISDAPVTCEYDPDAVFARITVDCTLGGLRGLQFKRRHGKVTEVHNEATMTLARANFARAMKSNDKTDQVIGRICCKMMDQVIKETIAAQVAKRQD